jgi:hypothetical protein
MIVLENRPSPPLKTPNASGSLSSSAQVSAQKKQSPSVPLHSIAIAGAGAVAGAFYGGYLRKMEKALGDSSKVSILKWIGLGGFIASILDFIYCVFQSPNNDHHNAP